MHFKHKIVEIAQNFQFSGTQTECEKANFQRNMMYSVLFSKPAVE